jgi:hypothetical protein
VFQKIRNYFTGFNPNGVYIRQMKNGRFRLLKNGNEVVATYNSLSGARQGAKRRGLELTGA